MKYDRYYYSIISEKDKTAYKKIYDNMIKLINCISISYTDLDLPTILQYIGLDNPHLFWVNFNQCQVISAQTNQTIVLSYWYTKQELEKINQKVNTIIGKMIKKIISYSDEYERELAVHNLLVKNVMYDMQALSDRSNYSNYSHSILGVLFHKTAVCEGIAKIAKLLLNILDIKCIIVIGSSTKSNELHAWNIAKINGKAYHLDITWDINLSQKHHISHDYFNLMDNEIFKDHKTSIKYPTCFCRECNYFIKKNLVAQSPYDIVNIISQSKIQNTFSVQIKIIQSAAFGFNEAKSTLIQVLQFTNHVCFSENMEQNILTVYKSN